MTRNLARVAAVLRRAVDAGEVPGVVAMAATDRGVLYQGAFGERELGSRRPMTLDTVFRIASMTKAVTCVAAMQLVERGKLALDEPVPPIDAALSAPRVLEGFDADGAPRLRPARRPITLRHLLTHAAGFSYEAWNANTARYVPSTGMPATSTGKIAALRMPLAFDPGDRWEYGINTDWVGRIVEEVRGQRLDACLRERIFDPLGMRETGFAPSPAQRARQATLHQRHPDGTLVPQPLETLVVPEFYAGGGGLYSTAGDYLTFQQMLLHDGAFGGTRLLRPETVALMHANHTGDRPAGILVTQNPMRSNDVDLFPGARVRWSLGHMLNLDPGPSGRSAGTVSWGGVYNTYYWIDPAQRVCGVILTQILPFGDHRVLALYREFERAVYDAVTAA